LKVIEDCAHAIGASYRSSHCGTLGDFGCFSFFSNKNMTTGEGGMIITESDENANKLKLLRSHGMTSLTLDRHRGHCFSYDVVERGYNFRIDEIRAAIGIEQLKKLPAYNSSRAQYSKLYRELLASISWLKAPFEDFLHKSSNHIFPVLLSQAVNRDDLMRYLKTHGIQTSIHYPPSHLFTYYRDRYGYKEGLLPITEEVAKRELTLPLYPTIGSEAIHYIYEKLLKYPGGDIS
jgi:dTDP-4-amino-4,6-dideoxygalactose transaminase